VTVFIPDWHARLGTAKEVRQHAEAVANLLERIHNAAQVEAFQKAIVEAIREADPATANVVLGKMRELQAARTLAVA
jgi:ABC-type Fe3+-hydroxamate transport system substrate-binding protein